VRDIGERIRAERKLQESEERFREVFENAQGGICVCELDGRFIQVNPALCTMLGYSEGELLATTWTALLHPGDLECALRNKERMVGDPDAGMDAEARYLHRSGTVVSTHVRASLVRDGCGNPQYVVVQIEDITERKKAEESLALLASIVESSDDAVVCGTLDGTLLSWNRGAEALFGYTADEIVGRNVSLLVPPDCLDEHFDHIDGLGKGAVVQNESVRLRKDGQRIHVAPTFSPVRNLHGEIVAVSAIYRDISERVRAERKLQESQERFRAVFEHASGGICVCELDGRFIQVNPALCSMMGYSEPELFDAGWAALCHPDDLGSALQGREQLLKDQGGCVVAEMRCIHRGGNVLRVQVGISLVRDDSGIPLYSVVQVEDITARKKAEESLALLASIVECSAEAIYSGANGTIVSWNKGAEALFGYTADEIVGKHASVLLPPDRYEELGENLAKIRGGAVCQYETVRLAKGGRRIDVALTASPIGNSEGMAREAVIVRDIGERVRAERKLREAEGRFREVFEHAQGGMCVSGLDVHLIQVNAAYCQIFGYSERELMETTWTQLIHPDDLENALGD
jgi:PAS domain S-box-containing protein